MIFFRRRSQPSEPAPRLRARVPPGQVVYAVGDIHGRADLVQRLADAIERDVSADPGKTHLTVFLGDYVDRGPSSRGVLETLSAALFPTPILPLIGNHETMLLDFLEDASVLQRWRHVGGLETLYSYGVDVRDAMAGRGFDEAQQSFRQVFPSDHHRFLQGLHLFAEIGDYFFCHAGIRPGVPLNQQSADDLVWIREEFLGSEAEHGKIVVHGHTPVSQA